MRSEVESVDSDSLTTDLEWVDDLIDLELSNHVVPKYIRSLVGDIGSIEDCARRLTQ